MPKKYGVLFRISYFAEPLPPVFSLSYQNGLFYVLVQANLAILGHPYGMFYLLPSNWYQLAFAYSFACQPRHSHNQ